MKRIFAITILLLIALIVLINFSGSAQLKAKSAMNSFVGGAAGSFSSLAQSIKEKTSFLFRLSDIKRQNEELTDKLLALQVDKSQIDELEKENALLKKELGFLDQSARGSLIPSRIIEREPTSFLDYFIVDKGSDDNVKQGAAVVFNGVLVGQVKEVYKKQSKVVLITSKDSIIQAMLQDSRAKGILKGGINGLFMENIISDTDYKQGEFITTSGLGGKMRPGILIGKAGKIQSSSSQIFKNIAVEPIIDLSVLELVFIEKNEQF